MDIKQKLSSMVDDAAKNFSVRVGNGMSSCREARLLNAKISPVDGEDTYGSYPNGGLSVQFSNGYYLFNISGVEGCVFDNRPSLIAQEADVYIEYTVKISRYTSGGFWFESYRYFEDPALYVSAIGVVPSNVDPTLDVVTGALTDGTFYSPIRRIHADGDTTDNSLTPTDLFGVVFVNSTF